MKQKITALIILVLLATTVLNFATTKEYTYTDRTKENDGLMKIWCQNQIKYEIGKSGNVKIIQVFQTNSLAAGIVIRDKNYNVIHYLDGSAKVTCTWTQQLPIIYNFKKLFTIPGPTMIVEYTIKKGSEKVSKVRIK